MLYKTLQAHWKTFLGELDAVPEAPAVPAFVVSEVVPRSGRFHLDPLDVEDRQTACPRLVDGRVSAVARAGLRVAELKQVICVKE